LVSVFFRSVSIFPIVNPPDTHTNDPHPKKRLSTEYFLSIYESL
jgi:hypothetical protein